ncbi:MAG: methyltransferase [Muribaculum sp.]|nr:methyltransferase [Muribaculum sp.]
MKVGTDGVLLGAWADGSGCRSVLDVGAGTGLISLMLAQRYPGVSVTALELDSDAVDEATVNVAESPWSDRIHVVAGDFLSYGDTVRYDMIISNPPFFVDALKSGDTRRSLARHAGGLNYHVLIERALLLLNPGGRLNMILPAEFEEDIYFQASLNGLTASRMVRVFTRPSAPPKRILVELVNTTSGIICCHDELVIGSEEYIRLTDKFYL